MRDPLNRRLPRELKSEWPKYFVIFLFFVLMISAVSGFLVSENSLKKASDEGFEKYKVEDGCFEYSEKLTDETLKEIAEKGEIDAYPNFYKEEAVQSFESSTFRVFADRTQIDLVDLLDGDMPKSDNELGIDRLFAENHDLKIGSAIKFADKEFTITGIVALSDYSCLFQSPSDMMFDNDKFGVGIVTKEGFKSIRDDHIHYRYSYFYNDRPDRDDDIEGKEKAEELIKTLSAYGELDEFIPAFTNQAIVFAPDDFGGDEVMITIFLYIVIVILAFVFSITISNTITKEASVIGVLRASGYTRGEMLRHYMIVPMLTLAAGAVVGNILGYTVLNDTFAHSYTASYSLTHYDIVFTPKAFILTTVIPFVLMFLINLIMLSVKLRLSPLRFLRHDLKKNGRKKAFRLNTKIPIMTRFRLRVIFQNMPNFVVIFAGVLFAELILMFSLVFKPMLNDFEKNTTENLLANYQYVLKAPVPTETEGAESCTTASLQNIGEKTDASIDEDVSIYGVEKNSKYVRLNSEKGKVDISTAYHKKYRIDVGDTLELKDKYSDKTYKFEVGGLYDYPAIIAVFMDKDMLNETLGYEDGYFNCYFSDDEIKDIDEKYIATRITVTELTKTSRQLIRSMGNMMFIFTFFGTVIFVLVIFLLAKIIIEKNTQSISMTKILGYNNSEINSLYIHTTSFVTVLSLIIGLIISDRLLAVLMFEAFKSYSGWFEYKLALSVVIETIGLGVITYALVALILSRKVKRIPLDEALKNVE
ncbi:ABC transporter permease [Ruminococcus sp. NK3A76]|uniref:ABC transporter permease n=1 Tax=Ruminococcus sp. NK3A76 TaxID=877411 RepID=UPI00048CA239|nr:ABC transporter permease [Ruminococcus sp. NK3A76]